MSRQEIQVTFAPASSAEAQFVFSPERARLEGRTSEIAVILHTEGLSEPGARFSESDAIRWLHEGPPDLEQSLNATRTILTLKGFSADEEQEEVDYDYAVAVEYEGTTFSSTSQYPTMSCGPTGGG